MSSLVRLAQILTTLLLHIPLTKVSEPMRMAHSEVILFHDVWARSVCHPLERLVEVDNEYPGIVEHIFSPRCVPLRRCAGCCNDERLQCTPTLTRNVTIQLLRISPVEMTKQYAEFSFLEHHSCECRPKQDLTKYRRQRIIKLYRKEKKGKRRIKHGIGYHNHFS